MVEKRMVQADRVNAEYIYENVQMCVANAGKGVPGGARNDVTVPFLDLVVYFRVALDVDGRPGTFIITDELYDHFGLCLDDLAENACKNAEKAGYTIRKLSAIMKEMFGESEGFDELPEKDDRLYVMTNNRSEYGAAGILLRTNLDAFADEIGAEKMVILPSSVHEILIAPIDLADGKDLRSIVNEVNSSDIINDSIFLSNNIYIYNRHGKMEIFSE